MQLHVLGELQVVVTGAITLAELITSLSSQYVMNTFFVRYYLLSLMFYRP